MDAVKCRCERTGGYSLRITGGKLEADQHHWSVLGCEDCADVKRAIIAREFPEVEVASWPSGRSHPRQGNLLEGLAP